jgi:hypothetical protein
MRKVGYRNITDAVLAQKKPGCMSCNALATKRVTFRDDWSLLRVNLCDECAKKEYDNLRLQTRIDWPGVA